MTARILVGLISLPLIVALLWLGGIWSLLLILAVAVVGGFEYYVLLAQGGDQPVRTLGLLWIAALVISGWQPEMPALGLVIAAGLVISLTYVLFVPQKPLQVWFATGAGALYLGIMMGQALALRQLPHGLWWILFAAFITFSNDTAAYFSGVTLGRHRLWPRLSPKKTWEGTIAGWVAAALGGGIFVMLTPLEMPFLYGMLLGSAGGIFALFGDLVISMVKRQVGAKDSGHLIPGHGGVLDRLDSLLFVLPLVYQVIRWTGW